MFRSIDIVTPPIIEPVTIEELKHHARIDDPDDNDELVKLDAQLTRLITTARQRGEKFTRRSFNTQTIDVWFDSWDGPGVIEDLPRGKVQEITGIYVYDNGGVETTVDVGIYALGGTTIIFNTWPPYFRPRLGIRVQIISGYGDDPEDVPELIREGILEYAAFLYENRLGEAPASKYEAEAKASGLLPSGVADKWRQFRIEMV